MERGLSYCLSSGGLLGTYPISSHFTHSSYVTGTLLAIVLVLNPRVGGFVYVLDLEGLLSWVSWKSSSFFHTTTPTGFYSQKLWGFILLELELWAVKSDLGLGSLTPKVSLPIFIHHTWMWDHLCLFCPCRCLSAPHCVSLPLCPVSVSLSLLPYWINVASLSPWLSDLHTVWFSDSFECYLFWDLVVILFVVVQGGEMCIPMLPFWLDVFLYLYFLLINYSSTFWNC